MQAFNRAVAHLLPHPLTSNTLHLSPLTSPSAWSHAQAAPQGLLYNSESEPDSDDEIN